MAIARQDYNTKQCHWWHMYGFGASVAGGCSIGNGLVETATMTWQGWIALASMIVGVWTMSHFIFVRPMKKYTNNLQRLNSKRK